MWIVGSSAVRGIAGCLRVGAPASHQPRQQESIDDEHRRDDRRDPAGDALPAILDRDRRVVLGLVLAQRCLRIGKSLALLGRRRSRIDRLCHLDVPLGLLELRRGARDILATVADLAIAVQHGDEEGDVQEAPPALQVHPVQPHEAARDPEQIGVEEDGLARRAVPPLARDHVHRHQREHPERAPVDPVRQDERERRHRCAFPSTRARRPAGGVREKTVGP
jgi:hypothetical protein